MMSEGHMLSERELRLVTPRDCRLIRDTPAIAESAPELDREQVEQALHIVGGNKSAAARSLGVSRRAFYRRLDTFGLR